MDTAFMPRDKTAMSNELRIELRVFEGPQRGARAPLAAGAGFVIVANPAAHPDDADIVLRDGGAAARVRVTLDMHDALLEVLDGDVFLGDKKLAAGEQVPWGMHAALKVGASVVAFGRAAVANWPGSRPSQPASATLGDDGTTVASARENSTPEETPAPKKAKKKTPLSRRPEVWLAGLGVIVLVVTGGAFGVAQVLQPAPAEKVETPLLSTLIRSEFSTLQATKRADDTYDVKGRLDTLEQRSKLDAWLAGLPFKTAVDVQVDESLARDVTETFRINGVSVQAQVLGTGTVAAEAVERDPNKLARAEEVVRRDVRGLTKLTVRNTAQPLPKPAPPVNDDPGKRIASLVPGDPGYVVTADGSRYFVGSMLPTGHRIAEVRADSVILELDGTKTTLNF